DFAGRIFLTVRQLRERFADRLDAARFDLTHQLRFFERHAWHVIVFGRVVGNFSETRLQELREPTLAGSAPESCSRGRSDFRNAVAGLVLNRVDDLSLAYTIAIADLCVVRKVRCL